MNRLFIDNSNKILKIILNKDSNLDILKNFIEAILKIKIKTIILRPYLGKKIEYLPNEEKYGIVNVKVIDDENNEINVGIQIIDGLYAQEKLITYGVSIHVNQKEYKDYTDIVSTHTINILDFRLFSTHEYHKIINFFQKSEEDNSKTSSKIKFHILELPKFDEDRPKNSEEEWMQYLKGSNIDSIEKIKNNNKAIKKLDKMLEDYWEKEEI